MTHYLKKRLPHRKTWRNQKISDAELIAVGLARIRFRHPHFSIWWALIRSIFPHYPSYTQAYLRIIRLRHMIEELSKRNYRRALVIVDSQPIPVAKFIRLDSCRFAGASTGYGSQGPVYGLKFHAMVSPKGELLDYRLRPANESDYRVALTMTEDHRFGSPIFIGDKAYQSDQFVTPPKKNVRKASLWKAEYARLRKRVETVFSQLVRSHIRLGQTSSYISLCSKVALTVLAHNLAVWVINP